MRPTVGFLLQPISRLQRQLGIMQCSSITDDLLSRDAFLAIYKHWKLNPATQLYDTDECKLNSEGKLEQFWPKPDWAPAYLENTMCIGHLTVYQMHLLHELGGFHSEYDGTQDFDLALRAALRTPRVHHLPLFAYIWRIIPGSAALDVKAKSYAVDRQRRAVLEYARHRAADAQVAPGWDPGFWRIKYPLASPPPLLSYVIPAGGRSRVIWGKRVDLIINCIRSFEKCGFYPNREYVVVHSGNLTSSQAQSIAGLFIGCAGAEYGSRLQLLASIESRRCSFARRVSVPCQ